MRILHVSFDLETLGSERPTSVIAQLGAVAFEDGDLSPGGYDRRFERKVCLDSCLRHGLTVDGAALQFWLFQPEEVRRSVFGGDKTGLAEALRDFNGWLAAVGKGMSLRLWSHSTFDPPILNNAYAACGVERGYARTAFRDLTTKLEDAWGSKASIVQAPAAKLKHDALWDSVEQADTLKLALAEERRVRGAARPQE